MIDVDQFKRVNDEHGHLAGDRLLAILAQDIQDALRDSDALGRLGGEEFGVVLPGTELTEAAIVAERIRQSVGHRTTEEGRRNSPPTGVGVGVAAMRPSTADYEALYQLGDVALYRAKAEGRNRISVSEDGAPNTDI